jgi:hypothetical protein
MYKKIFSLMVLIFLVSGCSSFFPRAQSENSQSKFTFDYKVPGKTKSQLWTSARNYLAHTYGDSRAVFSVSDEEDGILIGKGVTSWYIGLNKCLSEYHIKFAAKDDKARLQLEIIKGIPAGSMCNWSWPSSSGYNTMVKEFHSTSKGLEEALKGQSTTSDFMDF